MLLSLTSNSITIMGNDMNMRGLKRRFLAINAFGCTKKGLAYRRVGSFCLFNKAAFVTAHK
jgi:predicted phage tail protein